MAPLVGLTIVTGLEALYVWMPDLAPMTTDGQVAAFDLDGEGSLAVWFSSVTLLLSGLLAVPIYTIRRHKTNDYQGYYRVWLWAALCCLVMSIDETSSLHEGFKEMMTRITGARLYGDGSVWWIIPYFFALGAIGSRLLVDMRCCRLSSAALVTTGVFYAGAVVAQVFSDGLARAVMLEEGAEMLGNLFLLLAAGLHARHVLLDAEGLLPVAEEEEYEEEDEEEYEEEDSTENERWIKVTTPHSKSKPARKRATVKAKSRIEEEAPVQRKLTKQERKALRKRLMRERLEHERKGRTKW